MGDDGQNICRFRGVTIKNALSFSERYPGVRVIKVLHNFRCRDPIVYHAVQVITHNPARFPEALQTVRAPRSEVLLVYQHTKSGDAEEMIPLLRWPHDAGHTAH